MNHFEVRLITKTQLDETVQLEIASAIDNVEDVQNAKILETTDLGLTKKEAALTFLISIAANLTTSQIQNQIEEHLGKALPECRTELTQVVVTPILIENNSPIEEKEDADRKDGVVASPPRSKCSRKPPSK